MHEGGPTEEISADECTRDSAPRFIKEFSREVSQEERDALAGEIRQQRRERDALRIEQGELGGEKEKLEQELETLAATIESYNNASFLGKIKDYFEYKKTMADIAVKMASLSGVESSIDEKVDKIPQYAEARKMIGDFYAGERKKWAEAGYTPEDIAKQFTEERLSALSVDEYALLMRRFPGEMVTHVTRQGVRDHASSIWHTAGMGERAEGFTKILEDGRLRSAISITMQEQNKEEAMAKFLHLDRASSRSDALGMIESKFDWNLASNNAFADINAIHVASEHVADAMYGSEKGNEIFIAYPAAYIASQLHYGGKGMLTDVNNSAHNDKWIYAKDDDGMPLDCGVVFIPKDTQVGVGSGSKYELGEDGGPIENNELIDSMNRFVSSPDVGAFAEEVRQILGKFTGHWADMSHLRAEQTLQLEGLKQKLLERFGIDDPETQEAILNYQFLGDLLYRDPGQGGDKIIKDALASRGALYMKAKQVISSEEYWEEYFAQSPEKRPSKVVYYQGGDPSAALMEWKKRSGIVRSSDDQALGFPDRNIADNSEQANRGRDRLRSLALRVVDDRFPEPETTAIASVDDHAFS